MSLEALPDELAVSVVTHAELTAGVLAAPDVGTRVRRLATLAFVSEINPVGIDLATGQRWAELRAQMAAAGRRVNVNDMWIAATALVLDVPVVTQDDDFDALSHVSELRVIRV